MTGRERRTLRLGAAVVLAAVSGLRVIPAAVGWSRGLDQEVRLGRQLLRSEREALERAPTLEDSGALVRARLEGLAPRILTGRAESQATADLSERLAVLAAHAKVRLERADPVPDSLRAGSLQRVSVHATVEGDTRGMAGLVRAIGAAEVTLSVRDLRIVAQDPGSPDERPEVLAGELTVAGWFVTAEAP